MKSLQGSKSDSSLNDGDGSALPADDPTARGFAKGLKASDRTRIIRLGRVEKRTNETTTEIPYEDAVHEAAQIVKAITSRQMRLGELAHRIEPRYGDQTLLHFANEIGIEPGTLKNYR